MTKVFPRWLVAVFFAVFLLLGLLTAGDYGPTWDEQDEMDILRMNLWEYSRRLGMDETPFERRAAQENALTISLLTPVSESIEQDHGAAAFYPMAGAVMSEAITEGQRSLLWHMWCWVIFTLGAYALYGVCRELGMPRLWALLGPVTLLCSPQFFAHGHFNNKDIALMALALCVLWQGLRLMRRPDAVTAVCFSFFGALAANTKVAGLALWGLCALFVLLEQIRRRNLTRPVWIAAGVTVAAFSGFYALFTPALWANPLGFIKYLVQNALSFQRWQNSLLFRGTVFELWREALPWYYLPYMILATTPLWMLVLIALGTALVFVNLRKPEKRVPLLLVLCMAVLPLGFAVLTRTHVYNGWRHFYFVYGPAAALAAWGAWKLMRGRKALCALLAACLLVSGAGIVLEHPYQYAYYQPVVQLRGTDFNELDYWNISARDALLKLAENTEGEITIAPADLWTEDALRKAVTVLPEETAARFVIVEDAQYVLSNPTYVNFSGFEAGDLRQMVEIRSYDQPIMRVYERSEEEILEP